MEFTDEQQAFIDKLVGDARTKARAKAESSLADKTAKEQAKAAAEKLAADKEYEKLSVSQADRIAELEIYETQAKAYGELIAGILKDRVKALGESAKKAVDGLPASLTAIQKLEWLNKNEELFQAQSNGVGSPRTNVQKRDKTKIKPTEICKYPLRL